MKICFFADGESIHTVRWCKHFQSLGHEIHLISFKKVELENVSVYYIDTGKITVGGGNWKVLFKYREIKKILKSIQPAIFHAHYATSYGITGALTNYHPFVITALGSDVLISPKESAIYKFLLKFAFKKADWITAMAEHMKVAIKNLGIPVSKIDTVPFGIDPFIFNNHKRALSKAHFVVTSTRNFEKVYNLPHLLKAIALVKKQIPELRLNLIGDGSMKNEIIAEIADLEIADITTLYGKVPQPQIADVLQQSHLFISVSLSDGNNISLNEAMACGAFPIATNIPANTQWINHGINGFLVEINDVNTLAQLIVNSYQNYDNLQQKASEINQKIIFEKAIFSKNMTFVEEKYKQLIR